MLLRVRYQRAAKSFSFDDAVLELVQQQHNSCAIMRGVLLFIALWVWWVSALQSGLPSPSKAHGDDSLVPAWPNAEVP